MKQVSAHPRQFYPRWLPPLGWLFVAAALTIALSITLNLIQAQRQAIDAYLILGGSIRREIYLVEVAKSSPPVPVLISAGSPAPCLRLLFEQAQAAARQGQRSATIPAEAQVNRRIVASLATWMQQIWLENCADSTFGNFYFSVPILQRWHSHKVRVVTSGSHAFRALWMARILLGAHGLWVDPVVVPETGIPGNQEHPLKTALDISRSLVWAVLSQVYSPSCDRITALQSVNLDQWRALGFKCEHQGQIEGS